MLHPGGCCRILPSLTPHTTSTTTTACHCHVATKHVTAASPKPTLLFFQLEMQGGIFQSC